MKFRLKRLLRVTTGERILYRLTFLLALLFCLVGRAIAPVHASHLPQSTNSLLAIYLLALDSDLAVYEHELISNIEAGTVGKYDRMALVVVDGSGTNDTHIELIRAGSRTDVDGLPNASGIIQDNLHEYDMSDGATLGGLLQWARQTYPANQTMLTFVGHGLPLAPIAEVDQLLHDASVAAEVNASWPASIPLPTKYWASPSYTDSHPKRTVLTPKQLGIALAQATQQGADPFTVLDLVHCFGATIEELYEVAPYVQATVASPSYAYLKPEALKVSLLSLPTNLKPIDLARRLAQQHQIKEPNHPYVLTVVDNSQLEAIRTTWDDVAAALQQRLHDDPASRQQLIAAWQQTRKYDAPLCNDPWIIDNADYLADLGSLAQALQTAFPNDPVAAQSQQLHAQLAAAVTTLRLADSPWMRPDQFWNFDDGYSGVAIYGNLLALQQEGQVYLSFQGHFYDSNADEPPFRFIQRRAPNDTTWADLFVAFWQGQTVQTVACLPSLQVSSGKNADLGLIWVAPADSVPIHAALPYTLTLYNVGSITATGVTIYPTLPATVTLVTADDRCIVTSGIVNCTLPTVAPGTNVSLHLSLKPTSLGTLRLKANVSSLSDENNPANNLAEFKVNVQPAADGCTLPPWEPGLTYQANAQVSYKGHHWQAKWWTLGEMPGSTGQWGVWLDQGMCKTAPAESNNNDANRRLFLPIVTRG
ncbi:MAG: hypothetical protein U0175_29780 [Caldilineaceae bacterium]